MQPVCGCSNLKMVQEISCCWQHVGSLRCYVTLSTSSTSPGSDWQSGISGKCHQVGHKDTSSNVGKHTLKIVSRLPIYTVRQVQKEVTPSRAPTTSRGSVHPCNVRGQVGNNEMKSRQTKQTLSRKYK